MLRCIAHITIEGDTKTLELRSLVEFESEQTWRNLTQTAKLKLPRKLYFKEGVADLVKRGNPIVIRTGYEGEYALGLQERFRGYIAYVSNETPVTLECEDEMFKMKQTQVKPNTFNNATLADVLNYCGITDYTALGSYNIGKFSITEKEGTVAKVFEALQKYGINCFYRGGKLHCGNPYSAAQNKPKLFVVGRNIEKSELEFRRKEEIRLRVKVSSKDSKTSKITTAEAGDTDGELRTFEGFFNLSKEDLQKQANEMLDKMKYDGYRGSFTAWGEPVVNEGELVELYDPEFPEKGGVYWVDKITHTAGNSGIRQKNELGTKV